MLRSRKYSIVWGIRPDSFLVIFSAVSLHFLWRCVSFCLIGFSSCALACLERRKCAGRARLSGKPRRIPGFSGDGQVVKARMSGRGRYSSSWSSP